MDESIVLVRRNWLAAVRHLAHNLAQGFFLARVADVPHLCHVAVPRQAVVAIGGSPSLLEPA